MFRGVLGRGSVNLDGSPFDVSNVVGREHAITPRGEVPLAQGGEASRQLGWGRQHNRHAGAEEAPSTLMGAATDQLSRGRSVNLDGNGHRQLARAGKRPVNLDGDANTTAMRGPKQLRQLLMGAAADQLAALATDRLPRRCAAWRGITGTVLRRQLGQARAVPY